jgi:hypothetical protein
MTRQKTAAPAPAPQEAAPAPREVAPVTVAELRRRSEAHVAAVRQQMTRAAVIERAAKARVHDRPRDPETAAPVAPKLLDEWCDYTIAARLTSVSPAPATAILIVDALRNGPEAAAAVIASVSDLGAPAEYEDVRVVLAGLPRDDLAAAVGGMVAVLATWRRKQQAIVAAAVAAAQDPRAGAARTRKPAR